MSGRVLDDRGQVIPGAEVALVGGPSTTTNANGHFVIAAPTGSHEVRVRFQDVMLCAACFDIAAAGTVDLGDLYPGRDSGCGRAIGCPGDADCDGLPDDAEVAGYDLTILLGDGTEIVRHVNSDPSLVDTDGDGLADADEYAARTDPRRRDTDGDRLADFAEMFAYKSNPWVVDSDGDSRGPSGHEVSDPNLWDGYELLYTKTSPTLADTDGDGLTDWEEVHSGGTDPLVADLPRMALDLYGEPSLVLNVTDQTTHQSHAIASTLEKDSNNFQRTDTESTRMSIENTIKIHQEFEVGTSNWPPSYNAKITADTDFKHAYTTESMSSWTEASVRESQHNYETATNSIQNISYDDGRLWTAVRIVNDSNLAFRIRDLRIAALRLQPGGAFESVGTLTLGELDSNGWHTYEGAAGEFVLGPRVEYIGLVGASELPAQVMRALVSNPTALMFQIGSYSMHRLDQFGNPTVDFAVLGESVIQRTGMLVLDYGDGRIDRRMVATNVYRLPDGSGRGIRLADALDRIGVTHETAPHRDHPDVRVLTKVGNVESFVDNADSKIVGFWLVGGSGAVFDAPLSTNFDDLVLHDGERINLTFVRDADGDGIFDREEYLLGTDPLTVDSDHDLVSDYDESKVGWEVSVQGGRTYSVFSDPRFADRDSDYLVDGAERSMGTDPYLADTDHDSYLDAFDPNPTVPPCRDTSSLQMSAWWDGTAVGSDATDVWVADNTINPAAMFVDDQPGDITTALGSNRVFLFNGPNRMVATDPPAGSPRLGLSPVHEFSVAMWLDYAGPPPTVPPGTWGTMLTKGPRWRATYALSLRDTGLLRFSVYRRVFEKRWGWFFGWVDSFAEDLRHDDITILQPSTPIPVNKWTHVVATFGRDAMRLYVDGVQVDSAPLDVWSQSPSVRNHTTTEFLIGNVDALWLGDDPLDGVAPRDGRFNGYLDDVQYYHRALTADEIGELFTLGSCRPN